MDSFSSGVSLNPFAVVLTIAVTVLHNVKSNSINTIAETMHISAQ